MQNEDVLYEAFDLDHGLLIRPSRINTTTCNIALICSKKNAPFVYVCPRDLDHTHDDDFHENIFGKIGKEGLKIYEESKRFNIPQDFVNFLNLECRKPQYKLNIILE